MNIRLYGTDYHVPRFKRPDAIWLDCLAGASRAYNLMQFSFGRFTVPIFSCTVSLCWNVSFCSLNSEEIVNHTRFETRDIIVSQDMCLFDIPNLRWISIFQRPHSNTNSILLNFTELLIEIFVTSFIKMLDVVC